MSTTLNGCLFWRPDADVSPALFFLLVVLQDSKRRFEVLRLGAAVESRPVGENEPLRHHTAADTGFSADVNDISGDELTGTAAEHGDVTSQHVAGDLGRGR